MNGGSPYDERLVEVPRRAINDALAVLTSSLRHLVQPAIRADSLFVVDHIGNWKRGFYDPQSGCIVLHGFSREEIIHFEFVDILFHEIGHKVFEECLTRQQRMRWAEARVREEFPIDLEDVYVLERVWEEEFSIVFSMVYWMRFCERKGMEARARKARKALQQVPRRATVLREVITELRSSGKQKGRRNLTDRPCTQIVHERVMEWVFGKNWRQWLDREYKKTRNARSTHASTR